MNYAFIVAIFLLSCLTYIGVVLNKYIRDKWIKKYDAQQVEQQLKIDLYVYGFNAYRIDKKGRKVRVDPETIRINGIDIEIVEHPLKAKRFLL